jgi:hypothetical protein
MSRLGRPRREPFTPDALGLNEDPEDSSQIETLLSIRNTVREMTTGCEIRKTADGFFCMKHGLRVNGGDTRCESFVRRVPRSNGDDPAKKQIESYVNEILGIKKGETFTRLVNSMRSNTR